MQTKNETTATATYVSAAVVAKRYAVTPRFILKLAAEGKIPSLAIGTKCRRFDLDKVIEALEQTRQPKLLEEGGAR